jgi:hypothetical protein
VLHSSVLHTLTVHYGFGVQYQLSYSFKFNFGQVQVGCQKKKKTSSKDEKTARTFPFASRNDRIVFILFSIFFCIFPQNFLFCLLHDSSISHSRLEVLETRRNPEVVGAKDPAKRMGVSKADMEFQPRVSASHKLFEVTTPQRDPPRISIPGLPE